ncbi:MAG: hypothetical protein A2Y38_22210 [Spirochaetes bacterium GWB1_59_5]|nr:MAG: hypothetical protein A2Y38_22210 [Spirochaetes bacterium GWB1_59_5]
MSTAPPDPADSVAAKRAAKLKELRSRTDLKLRSTAHLKTTFTDFDGTEKPLTLRYYQVQGVFHLLLIHRFLLGDDTGLGKCCPYDTLLPTDQGLLRLGDLAPQGVGPLAPDTFYPLSIPRKVWTGWNWTWVKQFYCGGVKPTRRVRTRRGYETEGTLVHPLWMRGPTGESFTPLKDVQVGDVLCLDRTEGLSPTEEPELPQPAIMTSNTRRYPLPHRLTPKLAALLGYIVAEGYTAQRNSTQVTQYRDLNPEVHDQIRALFHEIFGWDGNQEALNRDEEIVVSSTHIRLFLEGLGVGYGLAATKCVPWPIFQGTEASVAAFLRAFWDGEGSTSGGVSEVSSASEVLLREIQILLLRFGILSSRSPKKVAGRAETYWRLTLCGEDARRFLRQVGCLTPRKREALEAIARKRVNANLDVVPHARDAVDALRAEILKSCSRVGPNDLRRGTGLKQFGVSFEKTLNNIRNGGRNPTYTFLRKLLDVAAKAGVPKEHHAWQDIDLICSHRWFYDPVVSITEGEAPVADIEVGDARHCFVGNGFVNHNTLEAIGALCYLWEKEPDRKVLVLTTKSATKQWAKEFRKFTTGVRVLTCKGTPAQRKAVRDEWRASTGPTVLIMGYAAARQDFSDMQGDEGFIVIFDEATAFKNVKTQIHQVCAHISRQAVRSWGLTATLIKNHLLEGHGIYSVLVPGLFGTYNNFMYYYCIIEMMMVGRGRKVPKVVGYFPEKVEEFRQHIQPHFLGRPKHEVATELPRLIRQIIEVGLTDYQAAKYRAALAKMGQMGTIVLKEGTDEEEQRDTTMLTAIIYCQQILDHPGLVQCEGESEKLDALIEQLTEGDLAGEKVIVFTRFRKMVDLLIPALRAAKVEAVRITGTENEDQRQTAQDAFQNPDSPVNVVCITMAGSDAINLQAAKAIIFYDSPWSAGDYIQILGRMIRIGSKHDTVHAIHLAAVWGGGPTVDQHVLDVLNKKMGLIEAVLGERVKGMTSGGASLMVKSEINDIFNALKADAEAQK